MRPFAQHTQKTETRKLLLTPFTRRSESDSSNLSVAWIGNGREPTAFSLKSLRENLFPEEANENFERRHEKDKPLT
jgi:hypothetical protein